jgi:hypothetical protein
VCANGQRCRSRWSEGVHDRRRCRGAQRRTSDREERRLHPSETDHPQHEPLEISGTKMLDAQFYSYILFVNAEFLVSIHKEW